MKAWSRSEHSRACFAHCQEFISFILFLFPMSAFPAFHLYLVSKSSPDFLTVLGLTNAAFCVALRNKIAHLARADLQGYRFRGDCRRNINRYRNMVVPNRQIDGWFLTLQQ